MSAAKRKAPAAPDMGGLGADWERLAALRAQEHAPPPPPAAEPPARATPETGREREGAPKMTRRSWYAEADAVQALAAAVEDIHHATRAPKHEVITALFKAAVEAAPQVQERLSHR